MKHSNKFLNILQFFHKITGEILLAILLISTLHLNSDRGLSAPKLLQKAKISQEKHIYGYLNHYIAARNPTLKYTKRRHLIDTILNKANNLNFSKKLRIRGQQVNPILFLTAIIQVESSFNQYATSPVGARGYMQLMPATHIWLNQKLKQNITVKRITETEVNIDRGISYFNYLLTQLHDIRMACLAYNAGPGNVQRGIWVETYWMRILNTYQKLQRYSKHYSLAKKSKKNKKSS